MTDGERKLSIAIIYDCLYPVNTGGGERVYRAMADRLSERGHRVDYVTRMQWDTDGAPETNFAIRPVWRGAIYDVEGNRQTASAVAFAAAVFRDLRRRRRDYDLVVVSALPALNVLAARLALVGSKTWLVADWLEVWPLRKWHRYAGRVMGTVAFLLQTLGLGMTDEVTVNSSFTLERARRHLSRGKGVVLGLVDLAGEQRPAEVTGVGEELVLFAGRHIADKRLEALPPAMDRVRRRYPRARLVVVGSGPTTRDLLAAMSPEAEPGSIDVRGRVSDDELNELMGHAAVLVNPSSREGFGLVVAEAAAYGTPSVVVSGEDNAAAELVEDDVNGFVAASVSADDLGGSIERAIAGGRALRDRTREWFHRTAAEQNLDRSLDELLRRYDAARTR